MRLKTRLIELSELPRRMRDLLEGHIEPVSGRMLDEFSGMSEVMAARGTLIHAPTVEGGLITRYRFLAPTRWNFDEHGGAGRPAGRIGATHVKNAQELSELMVNAIDPCVAYSVRVH